MKHLSPTATLIATVCACALSHDAAFAQDDGETATDATEITQELVADTYVDDAGRVQASSGGAEPIENWMACREIEGREDDCQSELDGAPKAAE